MSERFGHQTMYCCTNSRSSGHVEEKWFPTQGEAIANERYEIDNTIKFRNPEDIEAMRKEKGYEEIMSFIVEEEVKQEQEKCKPKRGRKPKVH